MNLLIWHKATPVMIWDFVPGHIGLRRCFITLIPCREMFLLALLPWPNSVQGTDWYSWVTGELFGMRLNYRCRLASLARCGSVSQMELKVQWKVADEMRWMQTSRQHIGTETGGKPQGDESRIYRQIDNSFHVETAYYGISESRVRGRNLGKMHSRRIQQITLNWLFKWEGAEVCALHQNLKMCFKLQKRKEKKYTLIFLNRWCLNSGDVTCQCSKIPACQQFLR